MPGHDIIVIGGSAGGVEALTGLVKGLPLNLPAALFVVEHFPAYSTSVLPSILSRAGPLPAVHAKDGDPIRPGLITIAPPNYHLLVQPGHVRLVRGPRENGHRPAIDPLFRSAALAYGRRVIGVILSGTLDDGTNGLRVVKDRGGVAVVQDPASTLYPGMPRSAIENVAVDHVVPIAQMGALLEQIAREPLRGKGGEPVSDEIEGEEALTEMDLKALGGEVHPGTPSGFACPDCGGALWELTEGDLLHFRCRVGHAFTADALLVEQSDTLEAALWTALRALEERSALARRLADRSRRRGHVLVADRFDRQLQDADQHAAVIREALTSSALLDPVTTDEEEISSDRENPGGGKLPAHG